MANPFAEIEREEAAKASGGLENLGVVPVPAPNAPAPRNPFAVIEEEEAAKTQAITPVPAPAPAAPRAKTGVLSTVGREMAEAVPFAPQVFGVSEKEMTEAREDRPVLSAATRFGTTLGEYGLAGRLGGAPGVGGLAALQEASVLQREGKLDFTDPKTYARLAAAGVLGAAGGKLLSKLPGFAQAALPVAAGGAQWLGAKDQSARAEALMSLAPMAAVSAAQGVRGAGRFLSSRGQKAGEQLLSTKGAELVAMREEELAKAAADVASAEARRRQLTGEQQTRLANLPKLRETGEELGFGPLPTGTSALPPEALPEAEAAVASFFRNAPEKFTEEARRVAQQQADARAAEAAAQTKWSDPLAVASGMRPPAPVVPGPVPADLETAARLLQQREIEAARSRVPEEVKAAARNRALVGLAGAVPSVALGQRALGAATVAGFGTFGAGRKIQQLLATDPKTKLFKDPAAANVIYDAIPSVVRKFPTLARYASLATDAGIRARPVFLLEALRRDPDFARAVEEEVTGKVSEE